MKALLKIIAIIVVVILVLSSVYVVFFMEPDEKPEDDDTGDDENGDDTGDDDEGDDNETEEPEYVRHVFIEEGTATWCEYCPFAAEILHDLYKSGDYNFYYVGMIEDKAVEAHNRLYDDYNIFAWPTVYIDGGYKVLIGGTLDESEYVKAIRDAESREVPDIKINVSAEYDEQTNELTTTVLLENNETKNYSGHLRVYLTEINSRWENDYDDGTRPYHFGFLDYIINKDITVEGKENITVPDKRKLTEFAVPDLLPEELMVIAAVFNSNSSKGDSWPSDDEIGEFDAYYADGADATEIVPGGNLPPSVGISLPEKGKLHILGRPIIKTLFKNTILIGKTTVVANAEDDSGIEKVEFYIDGKLKKTVTEEPYEYSFRKIKLLKRIFLRFHTITVKAYDDEGKTRTVNLNVITFFL